MLQIIAMARNAIKLKDADSPPMTPEEKFRAELGQLQREARKEYLRAGDAPLDWDGLEREIAERRGGVSKED
jgi:hypothetical protein